MKLSGWGRYPVIESAVITPLTISGLKEYLSNESVFSGIARGMGRSYGDSSLASRAISTLSLRHILDFDETTGLVRCASGTTLADLLDVFVPKGWFLPVTPGTKFVTVGGTIASDVHGKNHHVDGCLSNHLKSFRLMLANGDIVNCSREENLRLFRATCGGMGLTGMILEATIQLKSIKSAYINETILKASNLEEAIELFNENNSATYSVAWIDCLATGQNLGRSLIMLGEHAEEGRLENLNKRPLSVPVDMPGFVLNRYSISAFNALYYNRVRATNSKRLVHYSPFFYPLDGLHHWNRIYGKKGFLQYQFVISKESGLGGMTKILDKISQSRRGSFLAVLKVFGKENDNYLSFPMEGYTLALDFKMGQGLFELLDELDQIVLDHDGRVYLTKDARMSEQTFKKSYPDWEKFMDVRQEYGAENIFKSLQSERLGI